MNDILHYLILAALTVIAVLLAACIARYRDGRMTSLAEIREDIREDT